HSLAYVVDRDRRTRWSTRRDHAGGGPYASRGLRYWARLGGRDDDCCGRQPHTCPVRSGVCEAVWSVPPSSLERRDQSPPALSRWPPPSQRGALLRLCQIVGFPRESTS